MRSTCCGGGDGTVFELTPNSDGTYTESTLYSFTGASTGFNPNTDLVIDKAGNLYGITVNGGLDHGDGVVFTVTPQPGGGVKESIIHRFFCNSTACRDGVTPSTGSRWTPRGRSTVPLTSVAAPAVSVAEAHRLSVVASSIS
jgi:hypothetical protein